MKLTEKQKKYLKTTLLVSGSALLTASAWMIFTRSKLGLAFKDYIIDRCITSKVRHNDIQRSIQLFYSNDYPKEQADAICAKLIKMYKEEMEALLESTKAVS